MVDAEATRRAFAGLIEKPAQTDQLLSRPPFKFILDIIVNTVKSTGYLKEYLTAEDLNPNNKNEKGDKIAFLDKIIELIDDPSLGDVKSGKIVAGKEPEATNMMLVKFAEKARAHKEASGNGLSEKKSSKTPKVKANEEEEKVKKKKKEGTEKETKEKKPRSTSKSKDPDEKKEKSKEKSSKSDKDKKSSSSDKSKTKKKEDGTKSKKDEKPEKRSKSRSKDQTDHNSNIIDEIETDIASSSLRNDNHNNFIKNEEEAISPVPTGDSGLGDMDSPRPPPPAVREELQRTATGMGRPMTSMVRPGTAASRPAPPKLKKKIINTDEPIVAAVEVAPEIIKEVVDDTSANDFMVEEQEEEERIDNRMEENVVDEGEHGGLVQKMMETKAELEEGAVIEEIEDDDGDFTREKMKIENLQKSLQNMTRTTYPLARLFDFAQEDLESMIKELEKWRSEARKNEVAIKEKEANSLGEAHRLSTVLSQLDEEIKEVKSALNIAKGRITNNEEKIKIMIINM